MNTVEKDTQREDVRARIVEAARDIVSEEGLDALSMRALALRIGHSPGTIYHHFQDKDELLRSVMSEGFKRLEETVEAEVSKVDDEASPMARFAAMGRGYARFGVESTSYFRTMFKVPGVAHMDACPDDGVENPGSGTPPGEELLRRAVAAGQAQVDDPARAALVGWGLIHGLTSLYLSGHLGDKVDSHEEFMELIESAIGALGRGWLPK